MSTCPYFGNEPDASTSHSGVDEHEGDLANEFPGPSSVSALALRRCMGTPGNPTLPPPAAGPLSSSQVSPSKHQLV